MNRIIKYLISVLVLGAQLPAFYSCNTNDLHIERDDLLQGMNLILSDSAFNKIKSKRKTALKEKLLVKAKKDYVLGTIESGKKRIEVKARLKGDHPDHFEGNRWSFRIIAQNGKLLNHEKVSVQGVHTRAYLNEWVYHKLLEETGLISLQYEFFPFCVNDSLCGIYAFESHFDSFLLAKADREYGPIMKFDENDFWDYSVYSGMPNRDELLMINSKIDLCNKKWGKNKDHKKLFKRAKKQLDDFRNGRTKCNDVFDLASWAKFIAVNELMGGYHALRWHNLRFYFNPNTEKIEPIGFDCTSWMLENKALFPFSQNVETFHELMLKDAHYLSLIKEELIRISKKEALKNFFDKYEEDIEEMELLLRNEKPEYVFWKSGFYHSQDRIRSQLNNEAWNGQVE